MRLFIHALAALYGCICTSLIGVQTRLVPKHYDLYFELDPINQTLSGSVKCRVFVENKTEIIELIADQSITVKNVTIISDELTDNLTKARVVNVEKKKPNRLDIILDQKLAKNGTYELAIEFEGIKAANVSWNNSFYALNATGQDDKNKWFYIIDLTKNESKAVFPCFCLHKYGHLRTSFNMTIVRPKSFHIVTVSSSNTSTVQKKNNNEYEVSTHQTIPIPIRSFTLIATNTSHIYTVSKQEYKSCPQSKLIFGLNKETLICILHHLSNFYGTPMAADNISVVAIPDTLRAYISAFGVRTTSENAVNYTNPARDLQFLINDLSGQWWTHSTDGIHSSAEYLVLPFSWLAVTHVYPKIIRQSNSSTYENFVDLLEWSRSTIMKMEWQRNKTDTQCYFMNRDILTLNMIREILGEKLFAEGLAGLFSIRGHSLIREEDIWKNLTQAAIKNGTFDAPDFPQSVEEIVKPFVNRSIFAIPLLEFDFEFYGSFGGFIRQMPYAFTRWSYDGRVYANTTEPVLWKVPIQMVLENDKFVSQQRSFVWAKTQNRAIALTNFSQKEILLLNPDLRGPFVVKYSKNNWDRIFEKFDTIPIKYKIQLLNDLHVLAESSHYNYTEYIRYLSKIKPSKDNLPIWKDYITLITEVDQKLSGKAQNLTRILFVNQLTAVYKEFLNVSRADQPFWMKDLHDEVERYLCLHGVRVCNRTSEFKKLLDNIQYPKRSLGIHSCAAMQNISHEKYLEVMRNVTRFSKNYTFCDSAKIIKLLTGCSENTESLTTFLDVVFKDKENSSSIFIGEVASILNGLKKTNAGSSVLLNYFTQNWKEMIHKSPRHANTMFKYATTNLKTEADMEKALTFLKSDEVQRTEAKETIEDNVQRLEEQRNWNKTTSKEIENLLLEVPKFYFG